MGKEIEYKFAATAAQQEAIARQLGMTGPTFRMETTYYDTTDRALSRRFWTLRRRMENGAPVCTLKTPAGGLGRNEFECRCASIAEAIPQLSRLMGSNALAALTAEGVAPICGARFTRRTQMIGQDGMTAEVALDSGVLFGGSREQALCEVEVELKSGPLEAMQDYVRYLQARFDLSREPKSKFRRALDLAEGE